MLPQIGMLRHQRVHRFADGSSPYLDRRLFAHILPQRGRNVNLAHRCTVRDAPREEQDSAASKIGLKGIKASSCYMCRFECDAATPTKKLQLSRFSRTLAFVGPRG